MSRIQAGSRRALHWAFLVSLSIGLLAACEDVATVDRTGGWEVQRGVIQFRAGEPLTLVLPDTLTVGVGARLTLMTQGNYCTRPGNTVVSTAGMVITLEPYDTIYAGDCITLPCDCRHPVTITFPSTGTATLRVLGRRGFTSGVVAVDTVLVVQ